MRRWLLNANQQRLPALPKGFKRTHSQVFDSEGRVVLSKWWATASCRDAFQREEQAKITRMAAARPAREAIRALSFNEQPQHDFEARRLCLGPGDERGGDGFRKCRVQVFGKQKRCEKCRCKRETAGRRQVNLV